MPKTIAAPVLRAQAASILIAAGSAPEEAEQVAGNLVLANLSGHDSHGVGMLPRYVDAIAEGGLKPNAAVKVQLDVGTLLALDGQHGFGQIVGVQAMELGIVRAKQHGSCIFTLAGAHHLGRIGHFAEMATAEGLVSMHFVNVLSRPVVAPWGGGDGRFGTNPCCIGIPLAGAEARAAAGPAQGGAAPSGGGDPHAVGEIGGDFILDFATSRVAQGKMRVAHNKGERVAPGHLIDEHGRPTDNPGVVVVPQSNGLFGALMTFGEHKGYGMAVACELLGGALTGGGTWHRPADGAGAGPPQAGAAPSGGSAAREAASVGATYTRTVLNGMLTVLIDPARLGTQARFEQEANAFIEWLRQSPPGEGFQAVQIAGEPERRARAARERDGIWLDDATWGEIVATGGQVGVTVTA